LKKNCQENIERMLAFLVEVSDNSLTISSSGFIGFMIEKYPESVQNHHILEGTINSIHNAL